jgi:predicted metal-binding membrane protein
VASAARRVSRLMSLARMLSALGLIRPSRRRGFCPACRLFQTGDAPQEIAAPAVIALAFLIVAAFAWALTIAQSRSMGDMTRGLGSIGRFAAGWAVMMAAMMLPSATPLVFEFARNAEGRRGWQAATAMLGVTYLGVWLAFGIVCYALYNSVGMPWPNQGLIGGVALVIAGMYALTPVKRVSEAWCRELCALHGPLPFNLMRSAVVAGARYGLSCLGCSAGLMLAMVLIGMSNLVWMIVLTAVVLAYKIAPAATLRWRLAMSAAVVALGILYTASA